MFSKDGDPFIKEIYKRMRQQAQAQAQAQSQAQGQGQPGGIPDYMFDSQKPKESKSFRGLEKTLRFLALLLLCGLVWYFSYDHGRTDANRVIDKADLENMSLREKLVLAEADIEVLKGTVAELEAKLAAAEGGAPTGEGQAGAEAAPVGTDGTPAAVSRPSDDQSRGRLTLREMENKAAFGGEAILSLVEINSLDLEVTLRIRHAQSGRREARVMAPGDLIDIEVDGQAHTLYLDQIKGNMAFFILDGLPREPVQE
ncbi:MAG: hypothetical protein LBJ61_07800 [Deltaproteobacteria bacterium]|jgi:hypothetical protein|nr:hypothetical protein [Deltaproteobacteria bacterium]